MRKAERLLRQIVEQYEKTDGYDVSNEMQQALRLAGEYVNEPEEDRDEFEPTALFRAVGVNGEVWAESRYEVEIRARARGGDVILRQFATEPNKEWRIAGDPDPAILAEVRIYREFLEED